MEEFIGEIFIAFLFLIVLIIKRIKDKLFKKTHSIKDFVDIEYEEIGGHKKKRFRLFKNLLISYWDR